MTALRQGRGLPSLASLRGLAIPQSLARPPSGLPFRPQRLGAASSIRQQLLKGPSISNYSTWTPTTPILVNKPRHPFLSPSRPTLHIPKTRLAASLSTEAQRLLTEKNIDFPDTLASGTTHHQIGDFADLGFANTWWPSDKLAALLEWIHVTNQLPWWVCIAALTLILRITLFPFVLRTARNASILPHIQDRVKPMMQNLKEARESNDLVTMQRAQTKLMMFYRDHNYSPFAGFIMLIQIPVFLNMFRMLWRAAQLPVPGFQTGGLWWFTDLTVPDPYFLLPTISGLTTAWTVMLNAKDMPIEPRGVLGLISAASPLLSVVFIPILGSFQPSCIFVYWTVNNILLLLQSLMLRWAPARAFFGLMPVKRDATTPTGKPTRPGVIGAILDRRDLIQVAWKNYVADQAKQREEINRIYSKAPPSRTIKYETRKKEPADKKAQAAGAVETLK